MHVIGTHKVRFIALAKNGSTSLRNILKKHSVIKGWYTSDIDKDHEFPYTSEDLLNENIYFIYPLRNTRDRAKSAMLQEIHAKYGSITDIEELTVKIKNYLKSFIKYRHDLNYWSCPVFKSFMVDSFREKRQIKAKILFIDIDDISSNEIRIFCSQIDSTWKGIHIPHKNKIEDHPFKIKVMKIITELSKDTNSGVLDWFDKYNLEGQEMDYLLSCIRKSDYFLGNKLFIS